MKSLSVKDYKKLLELLATTPGATGQESERIGVIKQYFAECGIPTHTDGVGNLWVELGPEGKEDAVIYDAHVDVVGKGFADKLVEEKGRLVGAGAGDNLTSVALLTLFAKEIESQKFALKRPLKIVFSVCEEGLGNLKGVKQIIEDWPQKPFLFVSWDGRFSEYSTAGLGSKRFKLTVNGAGGHSWVDFGVKSAIEYLIDFLVELKIVYRETSAKFDEVVSYNIGQIRGGEGINCIASFAEVSFEFRSENDVALEDVQNAVYKKVDEAKKEDGVGVNIDMIGQRPAAKATISKELEKLVLNVWSECGIKPRELVRSTNINFPLNRSWPAICLGLYRGGNIHRKDEYVEVESVNVGWELLNRLSGKLLC